MVKSKSKKSSRQVKKPAKKARKKPSPKVDLYKKICGLFNEAHLTVEEILETYGNVGISLGCAIDNIDTVSQPLNIQEITTNYMKNPTVGCALIVQGFTISSTWVDALKEREKE